MRKLLFVTMAALPLSFAALANSDIDSQSQNNDINNQSNQISTGIVSNNPTYVNNGSQHAYGSIGRVNCAQASLNVGVAGSGQDYVNNGAVYLNVSIPFTAFGSGITCEKAMKESYAQMQHDTKMVLADHCMKLLAKGFRYDSSGTLSSKCVGFQLTGIGREMVETQKANLISDRQFAQAKQGEAFAMQLEQEIRRHDLCKAAADRGMERDTFCAGMHIQAKDD
ncbi:MAG: hypothetical protein ACI9TY_001587 [Alphaproteobacteria bacterium]|jgi:hypothetical protein